MKRSLKPTIEREHRFFFAKCRGKCRKKPWNDHVNTIGEFPSDRCSLIFPTCGGLSIPRCFRVCGEAISNPRNDPVDREPAHYVRPVLSLGMKDLCMSQFKSRHKRSSSMLHYMGPFDLEDAHRILIALRWWLASRCHGDVRLTIRTQVVFGRLCV